VLKYKVLLKFFVLDSLLVCCVYGDTNQAEVVSYRRGSFCNTFPFVPLFFYPMMVNKYDQNM